jgi:hypothetical protein
MLEVLQGYMDSISPRQPCIINDMCFTLSNAQKHFYYHVKGEALRGLWTIADLSYALQMQDFLLEHAVTSFSIGLQKAGVGGQDRQLTWEVPSSPPFACGWTWLIGPVVLVMRTFCSHSIARRRIRTGQAWLAIIRALVLIDDDCSPLSLAQPLVDLLNESTLGL